MDDFYINEPLFCCDVALLEPFMSSNFDPNSVTRLLTEKEIVLSNSVGRIYPGGTCFIIAKPNAEIKIQNNKVIGLALTNYHVAYNLENRSKIFLAKLNLEFLRKAIGISMFRYSS